MAAQYSGGMAGSGSSSSVSSPILSSAGPSVQLAGTPGLPTEAEAAAACLAAIHILKSGGRGRVSGVYRLNGVSRKTKLLYVIPG